MRQTKPVRPDPVGRGPRRTKPVRPAVGRGPRTGHARDAPNEASSPGASGAVQAVRRRLRWKRPSPPRADQTISDIGSGVTTCGGVGAEVDWSLLLPPCPPPPV